MSGHTPYHDPRAAFDEMLTAGVVRRRVLAGLIDGLLCAVLIGMAAAIGVIFGLLTFGLGFGVLGLLPIVPVAYNWLFVATASATPGQRMMGLVVRRNDDLGPPGSAEALVWALGFAVTMTLTLGLLWLCVVLLTERKRALHDILPGLVVVRARALTPQAASWNMGAGGFPAA